MEKRAENLVGTALAGYLVRAFVLFGTPAGLMLLAWIGNTLLTLRERDAVQTQEISRMASDVSRSSVDIRELQQYRAEAFARGQMTLARMEAVQKALERLEQRLDKK